MTTTRRAQVTDLNYFLEYGMSFWQQTPYKDSIQLDDNQIARVILDLMEHHYCRVVEDEGQIVGMIGCLLHPVFFNNDYIQATEVFFYVHPEYRSTGLGADLLREVEFEMKDMGVHMLALGDLTTSMDMDKFYTEHGYDLTERTYTKVL